MKLLASGFLKFNIIELLTFIVISNYLTSIDFQCFKLAEDYEETVEDWYFNDQDSDLIDLICKKNYLKGKDQSEYNIKILLCSYL